jgi:hypothetical protein
MKDMLGVMGGLILLLAICGCKDGRSGQGQSSAGNDDYLKTQLIGTWDRDWEYGQRVYERVLNADGTLICREFRAPEKGQVPAKGPTRLHRSYAVELSLFEEFTGTWSIKDGQIYYTIKLSEGSSMPMVYKIDHVSATEFIEGSVGVDAKNDARYVRFKPPRASAPAATSRKN